MADGNNNGKKRGGKDRQSNKAKAPVVDTAVSCPRCRRYVERSSLNFSQTRLRRHCRDWLIKMHS